jgi:hypothetical protein
MQRAGKILGHRMQFDGMLIRSKVTLRMPIYMGNWHAVSGLGRQGKHLDLFVFDMQIEAIHHF